MFRCQCCNQVVAAHTPQTKVVVSSRQMKYTNYDPRDENHVSPKDTVGSEIVKEIVVGPCCAGKYGKEVLVPTMSVASVALIRQPAEKKEVFYRLDNPRPNTQRKQPVVEKVSTLTPRKNSRGMFPN
jgi:hypothetical protein